MQVGPGHRVPEKCTTTPSSEVPKPIVSFSSSCLSGRSGSARNWAGNTVTVWANKNIPDERVPVKGAAESLVKGIAAGLSLKPAGFGRPVSDRAAWDKLARTPKNTKSPENIEPFSSRADNQAVTRRVSLNPREVSFICRAFPLLFGCFAVFGGAAPPTARS